MKGYHLFFTGKVQGVWFRRTSRNYAREAGLTGWVKNLPDGRVEMWAEGPEHQLQLLIAQLEQDFQIQHIDRTETEPKEEFKDFSIAY